MIFRFFNMINLNRKLKTKNIFKITLILIFSFVASALFCAIFMNFKSNQENHSKSFFVSSVKPYSDNPDHIYAFSVAIDTGDVKHFWNMNSCDTWDKCLVSHYRGLIANDQFHFIEFKFQEGGQNLLISKKSGNEYYMNSEPFVSPNQKWVFVASSCCFSPDEILLWEVVEGELILRFEYKTKYYEEYDAIEWKNSTMATFNMYMNFYSNSCKDKEGKEVPMQLIQKDQVWVLSAQNSQDDISIASSHDCEQFISENAKR